MGIYSIMFYGGLILAALFLILSIILFFVLKVPEAFGVVTGRTQKKAIEEIRSGEHSATTNKKKKRSGQIQARDIKVSKRRSPVNETNMTAHTENTKNQNSLGQSENSQNSMSQDAMMKKAAEEAKKKAESEVAKTKRDIEDESTEILTYNEMNKKGDSSEDPTTILEMEQATDILSQAGDYFDDDAKADAATDVLTSSDAPDRDDLEAEEYYDDEDGDEKTDVLRGSGSVAQDSLYDDDLDEEVDKTDVLTSEAETLTGKDVYGTYNPETTSVLRSDMAPGSDSVKQAGGLNRPEIKVIYSETVVHTEDSI